MEIIEAFVRTDKELQNKDWETGILQVAKVFPEGQPQLLSGRVERRMVYLLDKEEVEKLTLHKPDSKTSDEPYFGWCDVSGCENEGCCGGTQWKQTGFWVLCSKHSADARDGKPQPKMKRYAISREQQRDNEGVLTNFNKPLTTKKDAVIK